MSVNLISCSVYGCNNNTLTTNDPAIQYHPFPKQPEIAQQWESACLWRANQLNMDLARICSIHFEPNSYTNEYKKSDYLDNFYTKVLKLDAVPTLLLPYQNILKATDITEIQPMETGSTAELKPIIIYNINESDPVYTTYEATAIIETAADNTTQEISTIKFLEQSSDNVMQIISQIPVQPPLPMENLEILNGIKTYPDFQNLEKENKLLEDKVKEMERNVLNLKELVKNREILVKQVEEEVGDVKKQYNNTLRRKLTLAEQKQLLSKVFSESQIKILSGKKKIYWSKDDMAVGYTIRNMSNKRCYLYLSKNLNIPLPALSSLKRWATLKKSGEKSGRNEEVKEEDKFEESD